MLNLDFECPLKQITNPKLVIKKSHKYPNKVMILNNNKLKI